MLRFGAPNQCRGGGGQRAGRGQPRRTLIREHHQRSAACQDVNGLPQGRLRSRPFTLIKDDAQVASQESGEQAAGETFRQQTMDGALDRHRQDQRVQEARRVTHGEQGRTFRGHVRGLQQCEFFAG